MIFRHLGILITIILLCVGCAGFNFKNLAVTPTINTINTISEYLFEFDRTLSPDGSTSTNYASEAVPSNGTIVVKFPTTYQLNSSISCTSLIIDSNIISGISCTVSGQLVTLSGGFSSASLNLFISTASLVISNVLNPYPVQSISGFESNFGNDFTVSDSFNLQSGLFSSCKISFSPAYVSRYSTMAITITPNTPINSNSYLLIKFSANRWANEATSSTRTLPFSTSMSCTGITSNIRSTPLCTGSNSSQTITITSIFNSTHSNQFTVGVLSFLSPPTTQQSTSDVITITSYHNSTNTLQSCTVIPSDLLPNPFVSLTMESIETMTVNKRVGLRFNLTLYFIVDEIDTFSITFPSGFLITPVNVSGTGLYDTSSSYANALSFSGQVLTIRQRTTTSRSTGANAIFFINYYNFTAPASTKVTDPFTVTVNRNGFPKMTGTATIQAVSSTLSGSAAAVVTTVGTNTSYRINVTTIDSLFSNGRIKIFFPTEVTISTNSTTCASLNGSSVVIQCLINTADRSITLFNINSSVSALSPQTFQFIINGITNAPTTATTSNFSIESYLSDDTTTLVATGTITGVTPTIGTINSALVSVISSSYVVLNPLTTYTLSFTNSLNVPVNGIAVLLIPTGVGIDLASVNVSCKYSLNGSSSFLTSTCSGIQLTNTYQISFTGIAPSLIGKGTNISLQVSGIATNPVSTATVSSFGITTFSGNNSIQSLTTGINIQMITPATFSSITVSRLSNKNSEVTSYTFTLRQRNNIEIGGRLQITLPSELSFSSTPTCQSLTGVTLNCSRSSNVITVIIASAFNSSTDFGAVITSIKNPPSFKPISNTFSFLSYTADGLSKYSQGTNSFTGGNTIPTAFTSLTGTFDFFSLATPLTLIVKVTPSTTIVPTTIDLTLPSQFVLSSLACSISGFTGICTVSGFTVRITGNLTSGQMTLTVTGFNSPNSLSSTIYSSVTSYDSSGFKIDENTNTISYSIVCTLPCKTCTSNTSLCVSCYNSTINSNVYLDKVGKTCVNNCPSTFYQDNSLFECVACNSNCLNCEFVSTNCTSCNNATLFIYLNKVNYTGECLKVCPNFYYPDTNLSPVQCVICLPPCLTCTSLSNCQSCSTGYFYNGTACVTTCPANFTIANNSTNMCDNCDTKCLTCINTTSTCVSCSSTSAFYLNQCVSVCPSPLVINNGKCQNCSTSCTTCSISAANCTSCNSSTTSYKYLYGTTCLTLCPQTTYPDDISSTCKLCSNLTSRKCTNCSSATVCLSCDSGYVLYLSDCLSTTPPGFVNISGKAEACTSGCATCDVFVYNCTSCVSLNLENSQCSANCSVGKVAENKVCVTCTSNCKTCYNIKSNCTSCLSNLSPELFLSNFDCVANCPNFTYANFSNNECTDCVTPCKACQSRLQCTSCVLTYFLHTNFTCYQICPNGFVGIGDVCVACTNSCLTCASSTSQCLSCVINTYYISASSSCNGTCPVGLYPNGTNCTGCSPPCNTCVNTSSTCLTCLTGFLFNNSCVTGCPQSYFQFNSKCQQCGSGCKDCTSASTCTSCLNNFYLYLTFCQSTCPTTHPVINATGACVKCSDANCVTCNSNDYCSLCNFPNLLHFGQCVVSCPSNYTSNTTNCIYSPVNNTNSTNSTNSTQVILTSSLSTSNLFPVPFTIGAAFIGIACIMSKFQNSHTFIPGSLFSLWSVFEWGALCLSIVLTYFKSGIGGIQLYVLGGCLAFYYFLNLLALGVQNCYLSRDEEFCKWKHSSCNTCFYVFCSFIGLFCSHRFKNVMFCKLFNLSICKAKLQSVQNFGIFNIFSFIGFVPMAGVLFASGLLIYRNLVLSQILMIYIDLFLLTLLGIILAILNSRKQNQYFQEKDEDGIVFNKRLAVSDEIMNDAIKPKVYQDEEYQHLYGKGDSTDLRMKLKHYTYDSISELSENSQPSKHFKNISIQAEQIIDSQFAQSMIDHQEHEHSIPDIPYFETAQKSIQFSMKQGNDKSINVTQKYNAQVSVQHVPQINHDISIQNSFISARDISLQHAPNYTEGGAQIDVDQKSIGAQYSVKPIFQEVPQDFMSEQQSESSESMIRETHPVKKEQGLKAQLELDIDEKLKKRQEQFEQLKQQNRMLEKKQAIDKFNKKIAEEDQLDNSVSLHIHKEQNRQQNLNQLYNNTSVREDSSLINSKDDIIASFKKKPRIPSAKSEQEFIQMLSKNKDHEQKLGKDDNVNHHRIQNNQSNEFSLSFNVTKDLDAANQEQNLNTDNLNLPSNQQVLRDMESSSPLNTHASQQLKQIKKQKQVLFEEHDKQKLSDNDQSDIDLTHELNHREVNNIMRGDSTQEQILNDKSGSTNFMSTNNRNNRLRPPLPYNRTNELQQSRYNNDNDGSQKDQEIVKHPIRPMNKPSNIVGSNNLDFQTRTNLTQFLNRRNNNPVSAQFYKNKTPYEQRNQSKHSALPPVERLKSQQSMNSDRQSFNKGQLLRMDSRRLILDGQMGKNRRLEFGDSDRIQIEENETESMKRQLQPQRKLPAVSRSEKRFQSLNKPYSKPIHRQLLGTGDKRQFAIEEAIKQLQKEQKKAQNTKNRIQMMEYMLLRPGIGDGNRGYLKDTHASEQKKKSLEKVYLNKPKKYE